MRHWILITTLIGCQSDYDLHGSDKNLGADDPSRPGDGPGDDDGTVDPSKTADVTGRVCNTVGDGYVVGATASIGYDADGDGVSDGRVEDQTDGDGYFLLSGVPLGQHTILIEKGSFTAEVSVLLDTEGEVVSLAEEECLDPGSVEIAVVTGEWDNIQAILEQLGLEYDSYNGTNNQHLSLLRDPEKMAEYDIIFFNCGMSEAWRSDGDIPDNVGSYVRGGGSIYASDWAFGIYEAAFPGSIDFYGDDSVASEVTVGMAATIQADVLDANFQTILGSATASLRYDLDSWAVPIGSDSSTEVLIQGDAETFDLWSWSFETIPDAPLALRLHQGSGVAIYTSFHNENQITVDMLHLLEEIIYSL
ncbi:MAG: hypothetical protein ACI8S6_001207 [Myxococcota bacterium]|jgi:hypothetical protein